MNINIQPLSGHPYTINARMVSRSPHELLGISPANSKTSGGKNVLLMHPPILLIHDDGGEKLLNRESVVAQLSLNKKCNKDASMPDSLVSYLIKKKDISGELMMLTGFLFGPLQRIYHEKKDVDKKLNWKQAINIIEENLPLKSCIEKVLFNNEKLSTRHYMLLLRGANLSESSIAHMPGIKKIKADNSKEKDMCIAKGSSKTVKKGEEAHPLKCEKHIPSAKEADAIIEKKESNFDFNKSLEKIINAAERADQQRLLNLE